MNNLGVYILLDLRIDWKQTSLPNRDQIDSFSMADGEAISKSVFKALNAKPCTVCGMQLWANNKTTSSQPQSDFTSWLSLSTNADCQYEWLHQNIDKAIGKVIKVILKDRGPIFLSLQYEKRSASSLFQEARDYLYFKRSVFCRALVIPTVKYCPAIRLMYSEVQSLQNRRTKHMLAPLFDGVHANDTTTAFVCLAEYFKIMAQTNTAVRLQTFWLALLLALLQIYVVKEIVPVLSKA